MKGWPFHRKPQPERDLGEYTEPSFRGAILMLVLCLAAVTVLWLAYSWALNQPSIADPNGILDRVSGAVAALPVR